MNAETLSKKIDITWAAVTLYEKTRQGFYTGCNKGH